MREIAGAVNQWLAAGERVALATVIYAQGPSPRPPGSQMVVSSSGKLAGSVSGGCIEGAVCEEAQSILAGGPPKRLRYGVTDDMAWEVGLACGGTIEVYIEPICAAHREALLATAEDQAVTLATRLDGRGHLLARPGARHAGDESLAPLVSDPLHGPAAELRRCPEGEVFVQVFTPPPVLIIVGAVHIAIPLVALAQAMGFRVRIIDPRRAFATRERFPTADELDLRWPQDALRPGDIGSHCAIVILSHDPKFDLPALRVALRSQAGYVGLLGSAVTQRSRRRVLVEEGFTERELGRIHGPVGLDLGGQAPAEIALAVMAQIVAVRNGRVLPARMGRPEVG